jgi:Ser/Thr protein kinase RdoA (MazF antagonist)
VRQCSEASGQLLAELQEVALRPHWPVPSRLDILARYEWTMKKRLARLEGRIDAALIVELREAFSSMGLKNLDIGEPVGQHSDFGPWNVLVGRGGDLHLVDLHNFRAGWPEYDLAYFYVALDSMTRFRSINLTTLWEARRAFLRGYLRRADSLPSGTAFRSFCIMHAVYFAGILLSGPGPRLRTALAFRPRRTKTFTSDWLKCWLEWELPGFD